MPDLAPTTICGILPTEAIVVNVDIILAYRLDIEQ
jgi:hypothetical protein